MFKFVSGFNLVGLGPALLLLASGCAVSDDSVIGAVLEQDFQLRIGESAQLETEDVEIGFNAVISDSRCGKGETCVWEGDAVLRVWLESGGGPKKEHFLHTASKESNVLDVAEYKLMLVMLSPPAVSGRTIAPTDYIATLRVTRGSAEEKYY